MPDALKGRKVAGRFLVCAPLSSSRTWSRSSTAGLAGVLLWSAANLEGAGGTAVKLQTRHGELLVGSISLKSITVATSYGALEVPIQDVSRVDFARTVSAKDEEEYRQVLEGLRTAQDDESRTLAHERLVRESDVFGDLLRAAQAAAEGDYRQRLDAVCQDAAELPARAERRKDTVVARRFSIVGQVELAQLEVHGSFGSVVVERADIARLAFGDGFVNEVSDRVLIFKTWTDPDQEYKNVRDSVSSRTRCRLVEFTGSSAQDLKRALRQHRVLLLPELEQGGSAAGQVAKEAAKAIREFVRSGGIIISCGGTANVQFLTSSGLLTCTGGSGNTEAEVKSRHAITRGISGSIPAANATFPITVQGKPGMKTLAQGTSGGTIVGLAQVGDGAVVYCGWDYYESQEVHHKILANAVRWACGNLESEGGQR
jgi:hypothetical protein